MKVPKTKKPAKIPSTGKKPGRPPKDKATAPASKAAAVRYNSPIDEESKALFLQTLPKVADLKAKLATANSNYRSALKTAKKDGFSKHDFETAWAIQEADGEKAKKSAIARDLTIAKWLGADLGAQLDLFLQDERVPAVDRAREEGIAASMKGESAKPPYDPATAQAREWLAGFHSDQERVIKGIKKLEPKDDMDDAMSDARSVDSPDDGGEEEYDIEVSDAPTSGIPITRSQFKAQGGVSPLFNKKSAS